MDRDYELSLIRLSIPYRDLRKVRGWTIHQVSAAGLEFSESRWAREPVASFAPSVPWPEISAARVQAGTIILSSPHGLGTRSIARALSEVLDLPVLDRAIPARVARDRRDGRLRVTSE
jgi:hypothetical protein